MDNDKPLVLFVAAETSDHETIRLGKEFREVREEIERQGTLDFHPLWAARAMDLNRALREVEPTIVHFSGHGTPDGLFVMDSDGDSPGILDDQAVGSIFNTYGRGKIKVVVFNSCYSTALAREVAQYVDVVIGMEKTVGIGPAIHFSRGFYGGLSRGESVQEAFRMAVTEMETSLTSEQRESYGKEPQIHSRPGVRAWEVAIVKPEVPSPKVSSKGMAEELSQSPVGYVTARNVKSGRDTNVAGKGGATVSDVESARDTRITGG